MMRMLLLIWILVAAPLASADDISGFWKNAKHPAWIEIRLDEGVGTVVRNDKFPERVGRKVLKNLEADAGDVGLWRGQVYAERLGEYRDAKITLLAPDRMDFKVKVGFMSRTIEWQRVDEVPAAAD